MLEVKKYQVVSFKDDALELWVIVNCDDLCNCVLHQVHGEGESLACLNTDCSDNIIDHVKFLNGLNELLNQKYQFL